MARRTHVPGTWAWDPRPDSEGWVLFEETAGYRQRPERVRVRVLRDDDGRLEVRELHFLDNGERITPQRLRALTIGTIAQMVEAGAMLSNEATKRPQRRQPLKPPPGRGYPDGFYERVADAYRNALWRGDRPVSAVASEANVPRSTAARWVKESRRRGKLGAAPARGKAGA